MIPESLKQVFFEEAHELLAELESGVLRLEDLHDDPDVLGRIFRCAHSLKGNSAMVGLEEMAHTAHAAEDLLNALRAERIETTPQVIDVLLASCDILKQQLVAAREGGGTGVAPERREQVIAALQALASSRSGPAAPAQDPASGADLMDNGFHGPPFLLLLEKRVREPLVWIGALGWLAVTYFGAPLAAQAGDITGHIGGLSESEGAAVVVEDVRETQASPVPARLSIRQWEMRFLPSLLVVPPGSVVAFPNDETVIYHSVFSPSKPNAFELGTYRAGESREVELTQPGVCEVLCAIHSRMYAVVVVTESPYFAVADERGAFSLRDVPAGLRRLVCTRIKGQSFHRDEIQAEVPAKGSVEVAFDGR